jgi:hypothetical protein
MTASQLAVLAHVLFLSFFVVTEWVDLAPWNNVRGQSPTEHVAGTLVNGVPIAISAIGIFLNIGWLMWVGAVFWMFLLIIESLNWVVPHYFGKYLWEINPETYVNWGFHRTTKLLPRFKNNPVVMDGQHTIQIALTFFVLIATMRAVASH